MVRRKENKKIENCNPWGHSYSSVRVIYSQLFPIGHQFSPEIPGMTGQLFWGVSVVWWVATTEVVMTPPVATCRHNYDNYTCDRIWTKGFSIWIIFPVAVPQWRTVTDSLHNDKDDTNNLNNPYPDTSCPCGKAVTSSVTVSWIWARPPVRTQVL